VTAKILRFRRLARVTLDRVIQRAIDRWQAKRQPGHGIRHGIDAPPDEKPPEDRG